jgi:hypothetical protein
MTELGDSIRHLRALLAAMPPGPERDQQQGRFDRFSERLRALPKRVADRGPFATAAAAHAVLTEEFAHVIAAIDGMN